jgi:hypothetical protein
MMAPCHGAVATSDLLRVARMTTSKLIGKSRGKQTRGKPAPAETTDGAERRAAT